MSSSWTKITHLVVTINHCTMWWKWPQNATQTAHTWKHLTCDLLNDSGLTMSLTSQTLFNDLKRALKPTKHWLKNLTMQHYTSRGHPDYLASHIESHAEATLPGLIAHSLCVCYQPRIWTPATRSRLDGSVTPTDGLENQPSMLRGNCVVSTDNTVFS